jgi:hypothetical protein
MRLGSTGIRRGPQRLDRHGDRYFARNELSRLCLGVLRSAAGELLSTDEIAGRVIATKGFDTRDAILRLHRNGAIDNTGTGHASRWKLADA